MDLKEIEALIKIREHLHMVTNNINVGIDRIQEAKLRKNVLPTLDKAIVTQCLTPEFSQILKDILDPPLVLKPLTLKNAESATKVEPVEVSSVVEEKKEEPVLVGEEIKEKKPLNSFKTKKEPKNLTLLREKLISELGVADTKPAEEKKES